MYEAVIKPRKCGQEILRSHWYSPRDESGLSPSSTTLKLPSRFSSLRRVPLATSVPKPRSLNSSLLSDEEIVSGLSVEVMGGLRVAVDGLQENGLRCWLKLHSAGGILRRIDRSCNSADRHLGRQLRLHIRSDGPHH